MTTTLPTIQTITGQTWFGDCPWIAKGQPLHSSANLDTHRVRARGCTATGEGMLFKFCDARRCTADGQGTDTNLFRDCRTLLNCTGKNVREDKANPNHADLLQYFYAPFDRIFVSGFTAIEGIEAQPWFIGGPPKDKPDYIHPPMIFEDGNIIVTPRDGFDYCAQIHRRAQSLTVDYWRIRGCKLVLGAGLAGADIEFINGCEFDKVVFDRALAGEVDSWFDSTCELGSLAEAK